MIYRKCVIVSKKKGFNEIKTFVLYYIENSIRCDVIVLEVVIVLKKK